VSRRACSTVAAGGPPPVSEDAEVSIATQSEDASGARSSAEPVSLRANKLDLLERLADDLAHEIKNPLHSMVINLEVLKRRLNRVKNGEVDDVLRYAGVLGEELDRVHRRIELLLRLLIADDERHIAEGLQMLLADDGFEVDIATDGQAAWELIESGGYALVLADLRMPEVDGLELFSRMREAKIPSEMIIITGKGSVDSAKEAMRRAPTTTSRSR
jgi:CheY-like chemotaxis protein